MDLPPSAAPRRRAPPQGRLSGRSSPRSELRRFAALVAVLAGAPVSVARPRPRPKGTTVPGKPAPCGSRASPDPGRRPSTRRTVRLRPGPGAGGTRRQPSPARPAVAAYGISPRSRCGLPEPRQRARPVRSGPPRPTPALGTGRFRCYTASRADSFVGHVPFSRDSAYDAWAMAERLSVCFAAGATRGQTGRLQHQGFPAERRRTLWRPERDRDR